MSFIFSRPDASLASLVYVFFLRSSFFFFFFFTIGYWALLRDALGQNGHADSG